MKLEVNNKRKAGEFTNICKLNRTSEQLVGQRKNQKGNQKIF